MTKHNNVVLGLALALTVLNGAAYANDTEVLDASESGILLDSSELADASGKADLQQQTSDVDQTADLTDNTLTAAETGDNRIDSASFTNLQGIAHVIQNSGNNVIIQDSTTFNVQFVEAAN